MSNQYNIKYSSMDQLLIDITNRTDSWYAQLDSWKKSYTLLINMTSFTGSSATAVKSYLGEVHEFLLQSIYVAISRFQSDFLLYKEQYYNIEGNIYATMSRDTIKAVETRLSNEITYLNNIANDIDRSLNSVSDIFYCGKPSKSELEGHLYSEKQALSNFTASIENYESSKYIVANGELKDLLASLKRTIILYRNSSNTVVSYRSGNLCNNTQVLDLYQKVQSSTEYIQNNQEAIELASTHQQEVFAQMQKDYEEACEAREDEGRVKIITGLGAVIIGGVAIVCTAGAATPIVVTAAVAGSCSTAYGVSNMVEGGQDVYYGSIGDLNSAAINPIRDTVFMGNQGAYDLWGNLNMTVAGLCVPVSQSVNGIAGASNSVLARTAAKTIGKEVLIGEGVDLASSNAANYASDKLGLNQTWTTILNMGLNVGLSKGVDTVGTKISGKAPFAEGMSFDDATRYNDYWAKVESGNNTGYPGLTDTDVKAWNFADSKLNEHIAINKVDSDAVVDLRVKENALHNDLLGDVDTPYVKGGEAICEGSFDSVDNTVRHAVGNASQAQSVLDGINPKYFNKDSRFGGGFYVGADSDTIVAELAEHGNTAKYAISYDMDLAGQKVLDLTDLEVASKWNYVQNLTSTDACRSIGEAARAEGYKVIKFQSYREEGINYVVFKDFKNILSPRNVTPIE